MLNTVPKKKISKRLLRSIIVSMLALVLTFLEPTLYLVSAAETTTEAAVEKATQSAMEYYQSIEKANADRQIDSIAGFYGDYMENYQKTSKGIGSETTLKITLEPDISALLGMEDFKSVEASITSMQNSNKSKSNVKLSANDKSITTLDVLVDIKNDLVYMLVPELNKAYLKISNKNVSPVTGSYSMMTSSQMMELLNNNPLTEDLLNKLLKKYSEILLTEVNDVTVYGKEQVYANGVAADYTKVVVKFDKKTVVTTTEKVLKAVKEDTDLLNLCVAFNICTKKEYDSRIKKALEDNEIQKKALETDSAMNSNFATMTLYVDGNGIIVGREFAFDAASKIPSFGYKTTKNGNNTGVEAWYKDTDKEELKFVGKVATENDAKSGEVSFLYTDTEGKKTQPINLVLDNLKVITVGTGSAIDGKFTITGDIMKDISIVADCSGSGTQQVMDMDVLQADKRIVKVYMKTLLLDYQDFKLPSKSDVVYDMNTEMEKYLSSSDVKKFLQGINEKIDIKVINLYLDQMISLY